MCSFLFFFFFFFFNDTATTEIYTLSLHDALPICDASIASYERMWHGTGEWQRLAPVPVARDASPTDSIGVWLERSRANDGSLELRRVSAGETVVARASGATCDVQLTRHLRTFNAKETSTA